MWVSVLKLKRNGYLMLDCVYLFYEFITDIYHICGGWMDIFYGIGYLLENYCHGLLK